VCDSISSVFFTVKLKHLLTDADETSNSFQVGLWSIRQNPIQVFMPRSNDHFHRISWQTS